MVTEEVVLLQHRTKPVLRVHGFNKKKRWRRDTIQNVVSTRRQWAIQQEDRNATLALSRRTVNISLLWVEAIKEREAMYKCH